MLQSVEIDLGTVIDLYDSLGEFLESARSNFELYEEEGNKLANIQTYADEEKRKRTRRHSAEDTVFSGSSKMRADVYEIFDRLTSELVRRKEACTSMHSK
ncbi:hypothetical protein OUZ56_018667 [Daphnia magna]|uniref:Uncharacterized protein n=1 Tax=Daphnia magna TaxID=35525 RepID=A0ABQ9Z9G9_9CRUS|nr:hypothetical protein OUZ56_018667 [Daphnia magna]